VELIIVDNHSVDDTMTIAARYTQQVHTAGPERSAQRNVGIRSSGGEYLLVLDADMSLDPELVEEAVSICESNPAVQCVFIPERTVASGFWGACKKFERDFYRKGDLSAEAARFFRRTCLDVVGLYDEQQTGSEDWDLSDRIIYEYGRHYGRTRSAITHDEGHVLLRDLILKKRYYIGGGIGDYLGKTSNPLRRLPFPVRPSVRRQWYRFFIHPILGFATLVMKALEASSLLRASKLDVAGRAG